MLVSVARPNAHTDTQLPVRWNLTSQFIVRNQCRPPCEGATPEPPSSVSKHHGSCPVAAYHLKTKHTFSFPLNVLSRDYHTSGEDSCRFRPVLTAMADLALHIVLLASRRSRPCTGRPDGSAVPAQSLTHTLCPPCSGAPQWQAPKAQHTRAPHFQPSSCVLKRSRPCVQRPRSIQPASKGVVANGKVGACCVSVKDAGCS